MENNALWILLVVGAVVAIIIALTGGRPMEIKLPSFTKVTEEKDTSETVTDPDPVPTSRKTTPDPTLDPPSGVVKVKVIGGRIVGGGGYNRKAGDVLEVEANAPKAGEKFVGWGGETALLTDASAMKTTLAIPTDRTKDVFIKANYVADKEPAATPAAPSSETVVVTETTAAEAGKPAPHRITSVHTPAE